VKLGCSYIACGLLLTVNLAGCIQYEPAPLMSQSTAERFAARSLADPSVHDGVTRLLPQAPSAWPPREWDRAQLLAVALVLNPRLAVANAQVRTAIARQASAAMSPDPDLILESEYASREPHPWLYGVGLDWLLRSSKQRRLAIEAALIETGNARLQTIEQIWTVRRELTSALSEWQRSRRIAPVLDRLAAEQDILVKMEADRVERGEDSPGELLLSQTQRMEIAQQQIAQRANAADAQAAAAKALGLPPQALDELAYVWGDWGAPAPIDSDRYQAARESALLSRADLAAAIGDYSAMETKLKRAVARQYPQFQLEPGYYWDHGIAKWPFDVGFTLPFNRNRGEIAEARAERDLAGQRMLALQADIFADIASALRAEQIVRDGVDSAQQRLAATRRQLQQAVLARRLGEVDRHTEIDAQITTLRAELEWLEMCARLQASRNALEDALHAPLSGPELSLAAAIPDGAGSTS